MIRNLKYRKRWWNWWIASCILIVMACLSLFVIHDRVIRTTQSQILALDQTSELKVDCILVLGAGVWGNGNDARPSPMLADRLDLAISLYQSGVSNRLLMSGDHGTKYYDEVNVMKQYAIDRGVPSAHIFMDHAGFSTYESMYRARDIFLVKRMLIVTQQYHMPRAVYIAHHLGMTSYGVTADPRLYAGQSYRESREILARIKDVFYVWIKPKPTYLGDAIPITGNGDTTNDSF